MSENHLVIIGLGNPGKRYEMTRHNIGYLLAQAFAHIHGWHFKDEKRLQVQVAKGKVGDTTVHLVLPTTYMNESGLAAQKYLSYYKLTPNDVLVVTDDVALPFEEMRLREQGSAGGHNGLRSLIQHFGTTQFPRLRLGVGRGKPQQELADYVLEPFSSREMAKIKDFIEKGVDVVKRLLTQDITSVMNEVNQKLKEEKSDERKTESL